jgi:hypothetical protein
LDLQHFKKKPATVDRHREGVIVVVILVVQTCRRLSSRSEALLIEGLMVLSRRYRGLTVVVRANMNAGDVIGVGQRKDTRDGGRHALVEEDIEEEGG